jgi:hypothetical protein
MLKNDIENILKAAREKWVGNDFNGCRIFHGNQKTAKQIFKVLKAKNCQSSLVSIQQ